MHGHDGLFADAAIVPTGNLIGVPRAVSDEQAAFAAVVAGALHCCAMVRVEGKTYITVLGDGPVGLLAARALQKRNASVRVLGRHPEKLALCEKWGLKSRHIGEVGRHQDQDIVIDCTGSPLGTELATHLVRPRGTVIVKGWPAPARSLSGGSARVNLSHALANELTLQGAREGSLVEALAAMADGHLDPTPLISRRGALAEWQGAFAAASDPLALLVSMTV
jgi:threonine dehydrogenase-like Zn-dependent dehydrogenase